MQPCRWFANRLIPYLEQRIAAIPIERFRNFCIVAHVDHGKSTLSDRLLELTGTIEPGGKKQYLDKLDVERERGITVKAQTCSMIYNYKGEDYLLHLVDTPGHVDFRAEVSRSYASCGGALLLVDASQGVQAQTVANFYLAFAQGLSLVPVINKVDLPSADTERALDQMHSTFELDPEKAVLVSAKTGLNVAALLPNVVEQIPAPVGDHSKPLRLLLVDSWYSNYKGVILLVRIFDGQIKAGDQIASFATGFKYTVGEVGIMYPDQTPQKMLRAGQVGYIYFNPGMKRSQEAKVGDTYTTVGSEKEVEPLPGFEEPKSMVFVAAFPVDQSDYKHLEESIHQIVLNDRSVTIQKEFSEALGAGWRLGFLGTLHCSVFEDRLRQEHGASIIITPPTVPFKVIWSDGTEETISNPALFPDSETAHQRVSELQEPYISATITLPEEYLGKVIELCEANRGEQKELTFFTATQVILKYDIPLANLVDDFFGKLKGATKGYASLDYEDADWRRSSVTKLQLLVNKIPVDAVSRVVHTSQAQRIGKQWVTKFKEHVSRQMFEVVIQAAAGKRIMARETIKPFRKDVLAKLHASDVSRRRKLLEKQKEGRKKLRAVGNVTIDHKAFQAFLSKLQRQSRPNAVAVMQSVLGASSVKEQVVDHIPKRFKELKFGILSNQDVVNQALVEVSDRALYNPDQNRAVIQHGPLDGRMGTSSKGGVCESCGESLQECNGHFGYVRLALPAFHIGYFKMIITILQDICKDCGRVLLTENERRSFLRDLRRPGIDNLRRSQICKRINAQCRKVRECMYCGSIQGVVKKAGQHPLKIIHDKYRAFNTSTAAKKRPPESKLQFDQSFEEAKKGNSELDKHLKKALDDMNPLRVLNLFRRISATDCELLGMNPSEGRPEMFIWQYVPAPPICIRPSVHQDGTSTEDDITSKLSDIVHINSLIRMGLQKGQPVSTIMEQWDFLQLQIAMYINSDVPGLAQLGLGKSMRGFCQRLKGKQGRFRGNLSGKRVDFSGRTVISPDPNLSIEQLAVPKLVAMNLTYPEKVTRYNIEKLKQRVRNGANKWPGANYINKKDSDFKLFLKYGKTSLMADQLQIGDTVERHLEDGDIALFNRQPSLHKLSILSHYVKVRPWRTLRFNECVCNPYNADFDGDEMNLHIPQTEEARTEAINLMGVKNNLATPKNGEPIIAAIQDFITASFLISNKDNFYDRKTFAHICMYMVDGNEHIDIPPPSIVKPQALWTGKQIFNVLMRPNRRSPVLVNLDAACRQFKAVKDQPRDLDKNDSWLCIRNSEIMCGVMDKSIVGDGKKDSVFYVILRDFGPDEAVKAMNRLSKLAARWLANQGFSIGISDVYPGARLVERKQALVERAYAECDDVIAKYKAGKLEKSPGCDEEETMENLISGILSKVRGQAGDYCIAELSKWNSPLIMATCGSKGSGINVSQMVAVVGQQIISSKRVADGFQDRTLPHFPKNARTPPSKGFVRNSFFSGLTPPEFFFHAISGREGLVDTAVKTAETGYMSRRLMKSLEDLSTLYDDTVRNSSSGIVQFQYGDDKLDPVDMEAKAKPVHFDRTFTHAETTTWDNNERGLLPFEINALCEELLSVERVMLARKAIDGTSLDYNDRSDRGIDQFESARDFLQSIKEYVAARAERLAVARDNMGLFSGRFDSEDQDWEELDSFYDPALRRRLDLTAKLTSTTLKAFVDKCLEKYKRAQVEPGHAVGAVGAQSIGEPGTQMTLKTFHFAGVAGMSITQGVPRIKEIINASKTISTPVISCELVNKEDIRSARVVKGRVEKTYLRDIIFYIEDMWSADSTYVAAKVDFETIDRLQLDINMEDLSRAIVAQKKLKIETGDIVISGRTIKVKVRGLDAMDTRSRKTKEETDVFTRVQHLKRVLPSVPIKGYPEAARAIIKTDEKTLKNSLLVEGYGLRQCMNTDGIIGTATKTNSVIEMRDVLGIEAARKTIIDEISSVMGDMDIDPRHMQLLADVMTYKGDILGITRFGLSKMRDSVLQLASFEKTPDHLFDAAFHMKSDKIEGVSECIIMGQSMGVGTGAFKVVRRLNLSEEDVCRKKTIFEDSWNEVQTNKSS
ncbi:beta and beta-prime subunits of DNA dependent RNA-polymerase [Xylona heveae TC161]|uniref:DNA-directed RNA polymerase subunit n=1 Tax=Xylona heveae (strain CBS 132557 / TC161) TaxID=1328760 RepID=A0A164ZEY5_XYLHT|nr:beta and beta-prime subunits of DNA dependent RNA-polymerase [Xylona heveae TC161]KZF19018.1 beta and beta-prime subunits of DNA dependent RNA-polymerase [Xylona heveae TC161]